ncbi:MAG: GntR family transcriptional regulator [Anaerolineaceae bacterium]|nr:GntR family transcriptional regulator [Anaerolineaceae bacterium]
MEKLQINFRSGVPIYVQIVEQIQEKLLAGEIKAGDQLPTVRQMAQQLNVNFNTVARAYRLLDEGGLISTQQGRGTYIMEIPSQDHKLSLRNEVLQGMTRRYLMEADRLGFDPDRVQELVKQMLDDWREGLLPDE